MPQYALPAFAGLAVATIVMLLITQTKGRGPWPPWTIPAAFVIPFVAWTGFVLFVEGPDVLWPMLTDSLWGLHAWYDRLMSLAAAFFLLQNRARAAGMKSEVWVLVVIATGSIGLLLMLARSLYREEKLIAPAGSGRKQGA
jgi:hypothetical protein